MSLRAGLSTLGRTFSRPPRHARLDTRLLIPPSRSIVLVTDNENPTSKVQSYRDTLKASLGQLDVIHQYYPALAWEASQASPKIRGTSHPPAIDGIALEDIISRQDFEVMLEALAASGRPEDLQRMEDILSDMERVFELAPDVQTHSAIIRGLIQRRNVQTVQRWFQFMPGKPGGVTPAIEHYHIVLEASPDFASFRAMKTLVQTMWQSGCIPTAETYMILLRGQWKLSATAKKPPPNTIIPLLQEMRDGGIPYDASFQDFLYSLYMDEGLTRYAEDIKKIYYSVYETSLTPEKLLENQWIPRFSKGDQRLKVRLQSYGEFVQQGGSPSSSVFDALLRYSREISELEDIANALDMDPTVQHWSTLVSNNAVAGEMKQALVVYREAIAAGMKSEATLVKPILKEIFGSTKPPPGYTKRGMDIYRDFCSHTLKESSDLLPSNLEIHQMMLSALSRLPDEFIGTSQSIIKELQARDVPVHDLIASIIVARMNQADDYTGALKAYKTYRTGLNGRGYESVLEAFVGMCLQQTQVPPLQMYFSVVKDMKTAGFPVRASVYTILLRVLGQIGTLARRKAEYFALVSQCVSATRRTHDLITLDSSIIPDALLWNQLMDTYLRLSCFGDILRVWDQMYISRQFDNVSVSVVFDVCRLTRAPHLITTTYKRLERENFRFSLNNWHSYIEALCAVGRINDAVKTLCWEMGAKGAQPRLDTANLILHQDVLNRKPHVREQVFERIEKFQPKLYAQLEKVSIRWDDDTTAKPNS